MISIVIPALNEDNSIGDVVRRCRDVFDRNGWTDAEVVVVNDGSTDQTGAIAADAGARVVSHPIALGYGRSLKDGILAARHETLAICDADGTYPVERIPELLAEYERGFDMVVGARQGRHLDPHPGKRWLRRILQALVEFTAGGAIADINSGMRVFSRRTTIEYFKYLCNTFSFTTSLTLAFMMTGRAVGYVPIDYQARAGQSKVRLLRDSLRTLQFILEAILFWNPIKIFLLLCILLGAAAVGAFALALVFRWLPAFYTGVAIGLTAVGVFGIGLVAVLLKQILHTAHREVYPGASHPPGNEAD